MAARECGIFSGEFSFRACGLFHVQTSSKALKTVYSSPRLFVMRIEMRLAIAAEAHGQYQSTEISPAKMTLLLLLRCGFSQTSIDF